MHPNGQIPAYEWAFGDVNPPVHIAGGPGDLSGRATTHRRRRPRLPGPDLPQAPAQLHLVGEPQGRRGEQPVPGRLPRTRQHQCHRPQHGLAAGLTLEQADGTAWMASYCLNMAWAAVELALGDPAYEDMAVKFLEHYLAIAAAMNGLGGEGSQPLGRGGRLLLRLRPAIGRRADAAEAPLARRAAAHLPGGRVDAVRSATVERAGAVLHRAHALVRRTPSGAGEPVPGAAALRRRSPPGLHPGTGGAATSRPGADVRSRTSSSATTASGRSAGTTSTTPSSCAPGTRS